MRKFVVIGATLALLAGTTAAMSDRVRVRCMREGGPV
jgi:hypothetical protein